jgi:hypothetical protein
VLFIHFLVDDPILLIVDFDLDFDFDQEGSLNIEEEDDFGLGADVPKNELERVSGSDFADDPNGHHEDDLDSCPTTELGEKTTRIKPNRAIRCAFMVSLPF